MQGRRMAAFFFMQRFFCKGLVKRHSYSPITASAKQAAQTQAAKQTPATSRTGHKAVRRSVEQIRLTVSGLVTANVQAHGSWVRARTDYVGRSASCVKMVDCMNLFRISHASVRA